MVENIKDRFYLALTDRMKMENLILELDNIKHKKNLHNNNRILSKMNLKILF
jgi:hypothetical protein